MNKIKQETHREALCPPLELLEVFLLWREENMTTWKRTLRARRRTSRTNSKERTTTQFNPLIV